MDDNIRMTGKPAGASGAAEAGPVTRRRALGDIGTNVSAAAPAGGKPAVAVKPVSHTHTDNCTASNSYILRI